MTGNILSGNYKGEPINADEDDFMKHFICPITNELMKDPVVTPSMHRFERKAIEHWIRNNGTCPITRQPLRIDQLKSDFAIKQAIEGYVKQKYDEKYKK